LLFSAFWKQHDHDRQTAPIGSAAGITFLQQDQHEALGKTKTNKKPTLTTQQIIDEQAKAKADAKKFKQADAKTLGTTESLYKDVEFGGQLCLQVGIPLKPFCPSKVPCLARVLRFAASLAC
jgi:hypothetical protein